MTAFNPTTDLPSQINTVESLVAWGIYVLATANPQKAILEDLNRSEYAAQTGIVKAADQSQRMIGRASLELDDTYLTDNTKKLWMHVKELSSVEIPPGFKTN